MSDAATISGGGPPPGGPVPDGTAASGPPWSSGGAISFGWNAIRAKPEIVFVLFAGGLIANAISILGSVIDVFGAASRDQDVQTLTAFMSFGLQILNFPVACWIGMGMIRYALKVVRGEPAQFGDLFSGGPFFTYVGAAILTTLGILVGFLFCIVPGVILTICWCFWQYLVVDRGADVIESMRRSWKMTEGHRLDLFGFFLLVFCVNLLGLLACLIGVIVTSALTSIAFAWTYIKFVETSPAAAAGPED